MSNYDSLIHAVQFGKAGKTTCGDERKLAKVAAVAP
jgi:hypothetical protein